MSMIGAASAIQLSESEKEAASQIFANELAEFMLGNFDVNGDGTISADEAKGFFDMAEEMQSLSAVELVHALRRYGDGDKIWFEKSIDSILDGVDPVEDFGYDQFRSFILQIGVNEKAVDKLWKQFD